MNQNEICHRAYKPVRTICQISLRRLLASVFLPFILLSVTNSAGAATLNWTGLLKVVIEDTGTGTYTGGNPDVSMFSGSFNYGDSCGGCIVEPFPPDEVNYVFSGGTGSITGLGVTTNGVESSIAIVNDQIADDDSAALFNIFGITVTPGTTTTDVWSVASETNNAIIEWEVEYIYLTTNPFSSSSYTSTPPPNPDLIIFQVREDDEVTYFALGEVTTPVPLPASIWLFGTGLLGLAGIARRKTT